MRSPTRNAIAQASPVAIRLPAVLKQPEFTVECAALGTKFEANHLIIAKPPVGKAIRMRMPLPDSEIALHQHSHSMIVRMEGDRVVVMENFGILCECSSRK